MKKLKACRSCGSGELMNFLSLGRIPLSSILSSDQLTTPEERGSLEVAFCRRCSLVQLAGDTLESPRPAPLPWAEGLLEGLPNSHRIGPRAVVVALEGSHPALLHQFVEEGASVLYLEPHPGQARAASGKGIHIREEAFNRSYAKALLDEGIQAEVILANQLPAHSSDLNGLIEGLAALLDPGGVAVLELSYVRALLEARQFGHFAHHRLHYFSVHALHQLASRHGLRLLALEELAAGYLRYFLGKNQPTETLVDRYLEKEQQLGLTDSTYYLEFASHVAAVREALVALLTELRARGQRVAAFGANSYCMTLLNYVGLGREVIDFVVDEDTSTHGRFLAGVHIPIHAAKKLLEARPDYLLLGYLPDELPAALEAYLQGGGRLVVAAPYPNILKSLIMQPDR
ncbi:MAG: methyltransferase C-terminal domain-containing protein [Meiothermus ruber]|jgi:hypothetical protein|nr:methyltransferase C-terminal domain-containing protein [Meiothermus ruber]